MSASHGSFAPKLRPSRIVPSAHRASRTATCALATLAICASGILLPAAPALAATPTPIPTLYVKSNGSATPLPTRRFRVQAWVIADADTGDVLAAQDPHRRMPPASTLKLLTLYSMLPRLQADSTYTATRQDATVEGSKVGIAAGSTYSVQDLYYGLFLPSGNDAASAIGNAYGGWERTASVMNAEARRLHANNTYAINQSGLDEPGQYSSAYDMALIMRAALQKEDFLKIASMRQSTFPSRETAPGRTRGEYKIWTENRLLLNGYPGTIAGKTGFTSQAGRTFAAAVKRNGKTLIVALMHSSFSSERSSELLFDWGFANYDKVTPVGRLEDPDPVIAQPVPRAAQVLDLNGIPVPGKNARIPDEDVLPVTPTSGGLPPVTFFGLMLLLLLATLVALRVRVLVRIRRRRSAARNRILRANNPPEPARIPTPTEVDLRPADSTVLRQDQDSGSETNPSRW